MFKPHLAGWRAINHDADGKIGIAIAICDENGVIENDDFTSYLVWWDTDIPSNQPIRARMKIVADAACRALNTGARSMDLVDLLDNIHMVAGSTTLLPPEDTYELVAVQENVSHGILYRNKKEDNFLHIVPDEFSTKLSNLDVFESLLTASH